MRDLSAMRTMRENSSRTASWVTRVIAMAWMLLDQQMFCYLEREEEICNRRERETVHTLVQPRGLSRAETYTP